MLFELSWFDENDSRPYNINNLEPRPCDYEEVNDSYGLNHWKSIHPLNPSEYKLSEDEFKTLLAKTTLRLLTRRKLVEDDLDDFSSKLINWINDICQLYPQGVFVKMTHKSTKKSFEGKQKPLHNAFEVLGRLTSTKDIFQHEKSKDQSIYLSQWIDIDPRREYRVFYIEGSLKAISQQNCYQSYQYENREFEVLADAKKISEYKFDLYETATLDVAIVKEKLFLIECNPPSLHYGSGSALFREHDFKTFGRENIKILIR